MKKVTATCAFVGKGEQTLLGYKKEGFAKGFYNGIGGKVDDGESVAQAMVRELREETGLVAKIYQKVGEIELDEHYAGEHVLMDMHIYRVSKFYGKAVETDEMRPEWFDRDSIPYDKLLPSDRKWMEMVLDGKRVKGSIKFDEDHNALSEKIKVVGRWEWTAAKASKKKWVKAVKTEYTTTLKDTLRVPEIHS